MLGVDVGRIVNAAETAKITEFLQMVRSSSDPNDTLHRMARSGPGDWKRNPERGLAYLQALERGLSVSCGG